MYILKISPEDLFIVKQPRIPRSLRLCRDSLLGSQAELVFTIPNVWATVRSNLTHCFTQLWVGILGDVWRVK